VARAPIAGDMPVVSKSMTATVSGTSGLWLKLYVRTALCRRVSRYNDGNRMKLP
jgi:hypothetical protein